MYELFSDVRMVGGPPTSIGKYGGDTDNWMWPRHTGDFALLRIYMAEDGSPADYSVDNILITFFARFFSVSVTFFTSAFFILGCLTYI